MYRTFKYSVILIALSLVLSACNKDDDKSPSQPTDPPAPTGELSVIIGSETFTATSVTAREATNGSFIITALGDDSKVLEFKIESFIGNANYPLGPGLSNSATYTYSVNGSPIIFSTDAGGGIITIANYNLSEQKFDGTFSFQAAQVGGSSSLTFETGEFENVPILTLDDAEAGKATVFWGGTYHNVDSAYAQLNNNLSIEVFLFPEGYISPIRIIGLGYDNGNSTTITFGIPYSSSSTDYQYFRASQSGEISMTGNMEMVSGHMAMQNFDFEMDYSEIPIIKYPMEVQAGELLMKYNGNTVVFTQAESIEDYSQAPQTITRRFKATNTAGDSLKFDYSYVGQFQPNYYIIDADETGVWGSMKYFSNGALVYSETGYYGRTGSNDVKNYGFEPNSSSIDAMRMHGLDVPE